MANQYISDTHGIHMLDVNVGNHTEHHMLPVEN
jgi:hypothetical protein